MCSPRRTEQKEIFAFEMLGSYPCIMSPLEEKKVMGRSFRNPQGDEKCKMLPGVFSGAKNKCLSYIYIINVFYLCSF